MRSLVFEIILWVALLIMVLDNVIWDMYLLRHGYVYGLLFLCLLLVSVYGCVATSIHIMYTIQSLYVYYNTRNMILPDYEIQIEPP